MRPDLPLIAIVLAIGAALAIFSADDQGEGPAGTARPASSPDPAEEFLAEPSPALSRCLLGDVVPKGDSSGPPADQQRLVQQVSGQVERLRELRYDHPVDARFLSPQEMQQRLAVLLRRELPAKQVDREGEVLQALGALPPGSDLMQLETDALGSQVIGLYDPETTELLVQRSGDVDAEVLITLAHELEHALADQALGLDEPKGLGTGDRAAARVAVIEGDATLTMTRYAIAQLALDELSSLGQSSVPGADEAYDALPDYLKRSLLFPYLDGLRLDCYEWLTGGWKAVDRLYEDPPQSTYQVMFPAAYGDGPPAQPRPPGDPGDGWKLRVTRDLGAAELSWLFAAPGGDPEAALPDPRQLVIGWDGGELELWGRGDARALGIALAENGRSDALCGAMGAWSARTFPADGDARTVVACRGDEVRVGIAPDEESAERLTL